MNGRKLHIARTEALLILPSMRITNRLTFDNTTPQKQQVLIYLANDEMPRIVVRQPMPLPTKTETVNPPNQDV